MWNVLLVLVAVVLGVVAASRVDTKVDPLLRVSTNLGEVIGHYNEVGIREWKGIPYAQPPVGDLRWEYPLAAKAYANGVYEANFNANGCPQASYFRIDFFYNGVGICMRRNFCSFLL